MVEIYKCVCNNGQERCGKQMEVVLSTRTPLPAEPSSSLLPSVGIQPEREAEN